MLCGCMWLYMSSGRGKESSGLFMPEDPFMSSGAWYDQGTGIDEYT